MDQLAATINLNTILADAPGNTLIWNHFLTELIQLLNCDSSVLLVTDLVNREKTHIIFSANISQNYQQLYENKLNKIDDFNFFICKNPKRIFYNQAQKNGFSKQVDSHFNSQPEQKYRFGVSIPCNQNHILSLIISRSKEFKPRDIKQVNKILESVITPLEEALYGEQRLKINSQLLHHLGGNFDGYIIIDKHLNILFSDPVYTAIISQLDCIEITGNQFNMANPAIKKQLLAYIKNNETSGSVYNTCHSCEITLVPISSLENLYKWECYQDGYILSFTRDKVYNPTLNRLTEIHSLSHCEAICALHFMETPSIMDIAAKSYRSQATVRNHIKHIMQKMDVHNQAELMKKLLTLAAL